MTVADPSINLQLIALDLVYGSPRRSLLGSKPNRLVLAIIGCHLLLTIFLASQLNLWFDEAYSLATTNNDLATTLKWAIGFEEQAPFYFILLWFTRHIHDSILVARLPSILATAGTLWLSSRISLKLFPMVHRGWIVLALAFNPFIVAMALEARGYAWAVFLSMLLLWLFIQGYANSLLEPSPSKLIVRPFIPLENQPWARWAYGATAVIGIYSHYFLAFQIAAQGLVLLLVGLGSTKRRQRAIASFEAYCLDSILITALSLPLFFLISQQLTALQDNTPIVESPSTIATLKAALSKTLFRNLVYLLPSDPAGTPGWQWKLGRLLVGLWLIALAWGRRHQLRFNVTFVWLIQGLVMLQLLGALALVPSVEYRHAIVMISLVHFGALGLISLLPRTRRRLLLSVSLLLLLCMNTRSLWQVYAPMAKPGDYARVGEYLQQVVAPQEPVVVFNGEVAMALAHYYPGDPEITNQGKTFPSNNQTLAAHHPAEPDPSQVKGQVIPALIALPRSLLDTPHGSIPQYRQDNLILTSSEQIIQALALAMPGEKQALAHPALSELIDDFNTAEPTPPTLAPSEPLTPLQLELEAKLSQVNLSPETKAKLREALDLPPPGQQPKPPLPAPESIEAFLNNLDGPQPPLNSNQLELPPSLWLVRDDHILTSMASFDESYRLLNDFMEQNYRLLSMRQFHGSQVQQWQRLPAEFAPITKS